MQRMYDYQSHNHRMTNDVYYRKNDNNCYNYVKNCKIQPVGKFPECTPVAMAYVPFQEIKDLYDDCKALERGTVFPCLDKPFLGGCCK